MPVVDLEPRHYDSAAAVISSFKSSGIRPIDALLVLVAALDLMATTAERHEYGIDNALAMLCQLTHATGPLAVATLNAVNQMMKERAS